MLEHLRAFAAASGVTTTKDAGMIGQGAVDGRVALDTNGDGDLAAEIMREHTDRTRHTYLDLRDKEGEPEVDQQVLSLATRRRKPPRT